MAQGQNHRAPSLTKTVSLMCRTLAKDLFDPYRPERHYMRGPGPKWRAKNGALAAQPASLSAGHAQHA